MVRRKKSLLFSISLASAGLVAGALFVAAPKTQASEEELITTKDEKIQEISKESGVKSEVVEQSLKTHKLIATVPNVYDLKTNPDIIKYEEVAKNVYIITFADSEKASEYYLNFKNSDKVDSVMLDLPLTITDSDLNPFDVDLDTVGDQEIDKCTNHSGAYTYSYATSISDQCLAWGVEKMNLNQYNRAVSSSTKEVKVAVLDSGIRATHIAFESNYPKDRLDMNLAHDYYANDNNPDESDNYSSINTATIHNTHGTVVAGTIAESTPRNVKIVPVRVGTGSDFNSTGILTAIRDLKGNVDVINMSLGYRVENFASASPEGFAEFESVLKEAKNAGTIIVAATGNDYANGAHYVSYPASSQYTIGVGAVNYNNDVASFSQRGDGVDFVTPGEQLLLPNGIYEENPDSGLGVVDGTSASAPLLSASIANILLEHNDYNYDQVYNFLKLNTEDIDTAGFDKSSGWGSVSFHINRFADLSTENPTVQNGTTWTNGNVTVSATASSQAYNISNSALNNGNTSNTTPTSWTAVSSPAKNATVQQTITQNGTYTIWFKNSNNETAAKTFTVSNIDKTAPTISTGFSVTEITDNSSVLKIGVTDTQSGLGKIIWHYKEDGANEFTDSVEPYAITGTGATAATIKTFSLSNLEKGKKYSAYATVYDVAGNSKDSSTINFTALAGSSDASTDPDPSNQNQNQPNTPTNQNSNTNTSNQPKVVKTSKTTVKNPKTADINLPVLIGMGGAFTAVAYFVLRAKRR